MTEHIEGAGWGEPVVSWHAEPAVVAAYARGDVGRSQAWSLEAHLPSCATCRARLRGHLDGGRLDRNRRAILASAAIPAPGWIERALQGAGVPDHLARLLALTPSLRRSWLVGVGLVLGVAVGAAYLLVPTAARLGVATGLTLPVVPFLTVVPLLPLAGVGAAFSRRVDPMHDLAVAAPISGVRLFFLRAAAVLAVSLVPAVLIALALPGPGWVPVAILLPATAVSVVTLAASTVVDPAVAAAGAAAGWVLVVLGVGVSFGSPVAAFGYGGQAVAGLVVLGAAAILLARRSRLELGWAR